jgi:hypothetical protein
MQPSAEGLDDAGHRRDHDVRLALDLRHVGLAGLERIGEAPLSEAEHLPQARESSALGCHPFDLPVDFGALLGRELLHDLVESHRHHPNSSFLALGASDVSRSDRRPSGSAACRTCFRRGFAAATSTTAFRSGSKA